MSPITSNSSQPKPTDATMDRSRLGQSGFELAESSGKSRRACSEKEEYLIPKISYLDQWTGCSTVVVGMSCGGGYPCLEGGNYDIHVAHRGIWEGTLMICRMTLCIMQRRNCRSSSTTRLGGVLGLFLSPRFCFTRSSSSKPPPEPSPSSRNNLSSSSNFPEHHRRHYDVAIMLLCFILKAQQAPFIAGSNCSRDLRAASFIAQRIALYRAFQAVVPVPSFMGACASVFRSMTYFTLSVTKCSFPRTTLSAEEVQHLSNTE